MTDGAPRPAEQRRPRIGLIGHGFVGRAVFDRLHHGPLAGSAEVAFVHTRSAAALVDVPGPLRLERLADFESTAPDLVVEMAHPDYSERYGERILGFCDYLPLSVTALADDALRERLLHAAAAAGTTLAVPHGALMGLDSLHEWRAAWESVTITFRKHPRNIDFGASGFDADSIDGDTVLYDGPVRGIARLYPRNVNTMVTCALATVGLDRCRARFIASPTLTVAVAEVEAVGGDGSRLSMRKEQPAQGVSGSEMVESQLASILRAAAVRLPGSMAFV